MKWKVSPKPEQQVQENQLPDYAIAKSRSII